MTILRRTTVVVSMLITVLVTSANIYAGTSCGDGSDAVAKITDIVVTPPTGADPRIFVDVSYNFSGSIGNAIREVTVYRGNANLGQIRNLPLSGTLRVQDSLGCDNVVGTFMYRAVPHIVSCDQAATTTKTTTSTWDLRPSVSNLQIVSMNAAKTSINYSIEYEFPQFSSRFIDVNLDGVYQGPITVPGTLPWKGSFQFSYGLFCVPRATHTIEARARSCANVGYKNVAATAIEIDPARVTDLAVDLKSNGTATVTLGWKFEATGGRDVLLTRDGGTLYSNGNFDDTVTGSVERTFSTGCLTTGAHQIVARVVACNKPTDPLFTDTETRVINLQPKGKAQMSALLDASSGTIKLSGTYQPPPGVTDAVFKITVLPQSGDGGSPIPATNVPYTAIPQPDGSSTFTASYVPAASARTVKFLGKLTFCNGFAEDIATIDCDCGGKSLDPVFFIDGNMNYSDTDPLPPLMEGLHLDRVYDSNHMVRGSFGRGWGSIFDSRLHVLPSNTGDIVSITTPDDGSAVFARRHGVFTQLAPKGQNGAGTMVLESGTSLYVYRPARHTTALLYAAGDGRFAGYRELGTGRELRIVYNTDGLPQSASDSWTGLTWTIATDATKRRVTSIDVGGLTWQYQYDVSDNLAAVLAPGGLSWRNYEYSGNRMTAARDASGNVIESHDYDSLGRAIDSTGPNDEIANVQYNAPGSTADRLVTLVTLKSNAVSKYVMESMGGAWRTVQVTGGCSSCGTDDVTFVYDGDGHVIREQNASGYVTVKTYANGRLASSETPLRLADCDPKTSPTSCAVSSAVLSAATLEPTTSTFLTTYEYADPNWPDRATTISTPSLLSPGGYRRQSFAYHPLTGTVSRTTFTGFAGNPAIVTDRVTSTVLYGPADVPAFDPGGTFETEWLTFPQPALRIKSIDGPQLQSSDIILFVYYPVSSTLPVTLRGRLAASKNAAGHITRFQSYDVFGNVTQIVDPNFRVYIRRARTSQDRNDQGRYWLRPRR